MTTLPLFLSSSPLISSPFSSLPSLRTLNPKPNLLLFASSSSSSSPPLHTCLIPRRSRRRRRRWQRRDFSAGADDDVEAGGSDDYDMADEDEVEELDNKMDYDVEYDRLLGSGPISVSPRAGASPDDIEMVPTESFVSIQGWDSETVVDYRINEEEFHKISLLHCDFFIRKPPDPDNNVYDFREMYVTPPDTDVYSIPRILAPMPQKYIRCSKSNFGCYNVTEPPIDAPRDPMYKTDREILKVFLTKHYRNRRLDDTEFVLDFEEIYVIDSKSKSITRAKVVVTVPGGKNRDRRNDLLIIRDGGTSFKIIDKSQREDPTTVIEREEWAKTRGEMENHLRKLRDFSVSNWF
ncbi:PLASTID TRANSCRIPTIONALLY ACTIVE protein 6, chloroplastic [Typha angustifolia]|uniref:PLASTID TRANSCRIPTIONALLY ACTIVE protein 6, chloroplastic n=1 Tax=Typha angustifolia TaxID=59011 RepID=UPI003C30CD81